MRRSRKILLAVVVFLLVALVGGYFYERPLLLTGTGYAAHNACAVRLIAHRPDPAEDLPPNPIVPVLRTKVGGSSASGSILGVLSKQHAWQTDGFGCTLADARPDLGTATPVTSAGNPYAHAATPPPASGAVGAALDRAFGADLPRDEREALGTRAVLGV